jgi:hypothetical protein
LNILALKVYFFEFTDAERVNSASKNGLIHHDSERISVLLLRVLPSFIVRLIEENFCISNEHFWRTIGKRYTRSIVLRADFMVVGLSEIN